MELRHIHSFLVLSETLHFGQAARRLHLSQPGLSRQIQALERDLGVALFRRYGRQVALTPAGQVLVEHARRITAQVADARQAVASVESNSVVHTTASALDRCVGVEGADVGSRGHGGVEWT